MKIWFIIIFRWILCLMSSLIILIFYINGSEPKKVSMQGEITISLDNRCFSSKQKKKVKSRLFPKKLSRKIYCERNKLMRECNKRNRIFTLYKYTLKRFFWQFFSEYEMHSQLIKYAFLLTLCQHRFVIGYIQIVE
jgi:hypothetical protein